MPSLHRDIWLGIGTILFGAMLLLYGIPEFISAPSNVRRLVLSPLLWPTIVAWFIILLGAGLIAGHLLVTPVADLIGEADEARYEKPEEHRNAWLRLAAAAVLMIALVMATPVLGMVLASGVAFALFAILIRAPQPWLSLIVAVVLPLVLYFFFAHVAAVSIPQGRFITLP